MKALLTLPDSYQVYGPKGIENDKKRGRISFWTRNTILWKNKCESKAFRSVMTREDIVNDVEASVKNNNKVKMIENFCVNSLWVMIIVVVISLITGITGSSLTKKKKTSNMAVNANASSAQLFWYFMFPVIVQLIFVALLFYG